MMRYDPKLRQEALDARAEGWGYAWIRKHLGPSRRAVQMWAREDGLGPLPNVHARAFDPDERAAAVALYIDGMPSSDVAEVYGINRATVCKWTRTARGEAPGSETTP